MIVVCPNCGQETPEGFPRCANCGAELVAEPAAAREERKVVTVLFCDLVGFTSRAESMDPEDVRALLSAYHERVRRELERHGGTVEKFVGDAVMAVFGAPVAHEDDPERAVRAAIAIRDGTDSSVRIGITTGEAFVSLNARHESGEGMASGDVVNTASRLQAHAPEDAILVDQATHRATRQAIDYRESQPVDAKGKAEPVAVWEAVEARSRYGVDVPQSAPASLVGRRDELDSLVAALNRARKEHEPQLVTIVGVPGIGKSRLVHELFRTVEEEAELTSWRQGRSLPYGEGVIYWALGELVKGHAGILETDSAELAAEKLSEAVARAMAEEREAQWVEGHLRPLVGLAGDPEPAGDRRPEAFAAWRRFFEALAEQRPLVLVFEDLHWADDGLLDFVDYLADWASAVPLLLVCTARPELLGRRSDWSGGKPNAFSISLSPLSEEETAQLLHRLLDRAVLPSSLQTALLDRAGGNPLYAEEFARMTVERGSLEDGELPLPESLQGLIAARLDALAPDEKSLLQDASVVGKVFWPGSLAALGGRDPRRVEEALHALGRKQFVRRERRSSVADETQHAFLHLLVRDVAYGQIPRPVRAEKHRRAAEWIESLTTERSEDRAEMLAHHYLAALELAGLAGLDVAALAERARPALREAGDRAAALNAFQAATRFYEAALELLPDVSLERPDLLLRLAKVRAPLFDHDVDAVEEAVTAFLAQGAVERAAEGEALLAAAFHQNGQGEAADEHLARAVSLVADLAPSPAKVRVLAERSRFRMLSHDYEGAISLGRDVLPLAEQLGLDEVRASVLNNIGTCRVAVGDLDGFADLEESLRICLDLSLADHIHRTYHNLMDSYRRTGQLAESARVLAEERRTDEYYGFDRLLRDWVAGEEAVDGYLRGDWTTALERAEAVSHDASVGRAFYMESSVRFVRAAIRFARGDDQGADEDSARAVDRARDQKDPQVLVPSLAARALVLLRSGRREAAAELVDDALSHSSPYYGALLDLAWTLVDLGRPEEFLHLAPQIVSTPWSEAAFAIASGRVAEAAAVLGKIGAVSDEAYALLRTGEAPGVRRAVDFYRSVGATRYVHEGEAALARSA